MTDLFWVAITLIGITGSACCSGMETSLYVVNRVRLALRAGASQPEAAAVRLRREIAHPERSISTLLIANNIFNYIGVLGVTSLLEGHGLTSVQVLIVNSAIVTPMLLVFGESIPKEYFRLEADRVAYLFAPVITVMRTIVTIVGALPALLLFVKLVSRVFGASPEAALRSDARRRVALLLKEGIGHGLISATQSTLIDRALVLSRTTVAEVMVPWRRVAWITPTWEIRSAQRLAAQRGLTQLPVADGGRVLGMCALDRVPSSDAAVTLSDAMREPARIDPDQPITQAAEAVAKSPARVGIVEKAGKPVGIVALTDLASPLIAPTVSGATVGRPAQSRPG